MLIIRGELLKKYPNTVIFAQHAKMVDGLRAPDWLTAGGRSSTAAVEDPHARCITAHPEDDIFFFGFDLTIDEVKGNGRRSGLVLRAAGAAG